ncbi:MAG: hypothetical protein KBS62_07915 [Oscillospiraceae bacterium]|nr:hypothetical protein [Candidatus Ruminococcus equi]
METIIASVGSALISGIIAVIVSVINTNSNHTKLMNELQKRDEMQMYRIEQLEKKVDKHNNVIERTYNLEKQTELQEEKIKVVNHRISDLENRKD